MRLSMHRVDHAIAAYRLRMERQSKAAQYFWGGCFIAVTAGCIVLCPHWF